MSSEQFDLFLILLKLKSYLVSLVDKPETENNPFELTEEYLDRKYPDHKEEVLELLVSFKINGDADIAFDEKMHLKFKEMVKAKEGAYNLSSILETILANTENNSICLSSETEAGSWISSLGDRLSI